ncbi:MAG: hypothetical protein NWE96_07525 [Candidatus Bathyarchaeota archaeon]|nr:hypothetical protein [Candidatus Bathyarchaeota archaeon]
MRTTLLVAMVILFVLGAFAVALSTRIFGQVETSTSLSPSQTQVIPQTKKVQIIINCNCAWNGTYADSPITAPIAIDISGKGNKTVVLDRPSDCLERWVLSVTAQKHGSITDDLLTISILKMDGTVIDTVSTKTNMPISLTEIIED